MQHPILPGQALRTIHTSAIADFGALPPEARANTGFAGSTPANEAVHICGPSAWQPSAGAAQHLGSRS